MKRSFIRLVECVDSIDSYGQSPFVKRRFVNYTYLFILFAALKKLIQLEYFDVPPSPSPLRIVSFSNEEREARNSFISFREFF